MMTYAYIWTYTINPDHHEAFIRAYAPGGEWTRLFEKAEGYLRTELLQDRADPNTFLTIDHWQSLDHWTTFRKQHAHAFEALDEDCERLTTSETELGRYNTLTPLRHFPSTTHKQG